MSREVSYDVVIVGSGPAAYVAGLYSATAKFRTVIFEQKTPYTTDYKNYERIPGILSENVHSNEDFNRLLRDQTSQFDVDFETEDVSSIELGENIKVKTKNQTIICKTLIMDDLGCLKRLLSQFNVVRVDLKSSRTNFKNVFVCGSASEIEKEAVLYCGSGCTAALDSKDYINSL